MPTHSPAFAAIAAAPPVMNLRCQLQEYTDTTESYLDGHDVVPGDCWRTALACLLEVPRDDVPHFIHLYEGGTGAPGEDVENHPDGPRWWRESVAWVERQRPGWTIQAWAPGDWPFYADDAVDAPDRVLLTGRSPRGDWSHVVLVDAKTGALSWDPFPGGQGVLAPHVDRVALVRAEGLA
jgi:hypothetical protein